MTGNPHNDTGMDRTIERRPLRRWIIGAVVAVAIVAAVIAWRSIDTSTSFTLDGQRIRIAEVETGVYEDFIPLRAAIEPERTVYLDWNMARTWLERRLA